MKALNLETFPLDGLTLIEASAGTGKTYALANLYLRYLLERQFTVDQILVVTFTEAATQELKDRIRRRIHELIDVFESHMNPSTNSLETSADDSILMALFRQSSQPAADQLRLKVAERQIDQAEIHTIHGFCQRLLREHALDSRVPLQQTLVEDLKPMLKQVTEDYWRVVVLALKKTELEFVCRHWSGPEVLLRDMLPMLNRAPEAIFPEPDSTGLSAWSEVFDAARNWYLILKQETLQVIDEVTECVARSGLKRLNDKLNWLAKIRDWCQQDTVDFSFPSTSSKANLFAEFIPASLLEQTKAKSPVPEHPFFDFLADYLPGAPHGIKERFMTQSYQEVLRSLQQQKRSQAVFGFDDLISQVASALDSGSSQQQQRQVDRFTAVIRQRYQVALIDEFQDTDKAQYHIFSTLFGPKAGDQASRLVLIGDPKQAIYAFRGGDIATYLKAKHEIMAHPRGELLTMDTNWRSDPAMIHSVNCLFAGQQNPFMAEDIPFYQVKAGNEQGQYSNKVALTITQLEAGSMNKARMTEALAQECVARVLSLLGSRHQKTGPEDGPVFSSEDIAILVRSGAEGELVKARLAESGITASYEGKSSIFDTAEARSIYFLMLAVAEPHNERAIWRCLAEHLFGYQDWQFAALQSQSSELADMLARFAALHESWVRGGVLVMIREALGQLQVFAHWQKQGRTADSGEWQRSLTNINQLAELLQQQSAVYRGHFALIRWLGDRILGAEAADDDSKLRLESDEKLVRIVTIHKSKGLEYPVVILPFMFSARAADSAWYYDGEGRLTLDLCGSEQHLAMADAERLAEDMRLLYVALTRAKYRCYLGTCAYKGSGVGSLGLNRSAWAYLLFGDAIPETLDDASLNERLIQCSNQSQGSIITQRLSDSDIAERLAEYQAVQQPDCAVSNTDVLRSRALGRAIDQRFRVQSFTGLMHEHHARQTRMFSEADFPMGGVLSPENKANNDLTILDFPKGSRAGIFLHTLFETIDFATAQPAEHLLLQYPTLERLVTSQLELSRLVDSTKLADWSSYLCVWLRSVLKTPLKSGFCLSDLQASDYIAEMAFHYPVNSLSASRFNILLRQHGHDVADLEFATFEGQFKGAIDLVFKAGEQFFVLDYKSNYLGAQTSDYAPENLQLSIDEHRYDVQYLLYTLAVHRYLKHRLGRRYQYQRDFGGVLYLYLRGVLVPDSKPVGSGGTTGVYFIKPACELIEALDLEMAS